MLIFVLFEAVTISAEAGFLLILGLNANIKGRMIIPTRASIENGVFLHVLNQTVSVTVSLRTSRGAVRDSGTIPAAATVVLYQIQSPS